MASNSVSFVVNPQTPNRTKYPSNELSTVSSSSSTRSFEPSLAQQNVNLANLDFHSLRARHSRIRRAPSTGAALEAENANGHTQHQRSPLHPSRTSPDHRGSVSSDILDSSSEWILFSPGQSEHGKPSDDPYYDDLLSTTADRTSRQTTNEESYVDIEREENDDDDDSLIDDLQDHIDSNTPYKKEDLNSRIDSWRRQQVSVLLHDLSGGQSDLDNDAMDLIKAWGVDDSTFSNLHQLQGSNLHKATAINKFYGDGILLSYSSEDLIVLKRVLEDLSTSLRKTVRAKRRRSSVPQMPTRTVSTSTITTMHTQTAKKRDSDQFMNNKSLQKYIPFFLKNLIITSDLLPQFEQLDDETDTEDNSKKDVETGPMAPYISARKESLISNLSEGVVVSASDDSESRSRRRRRHQSSNDNFWETSDLKSANSSILTYSTGSILGF
ncbi:hypothetical protein OGAPHI_000989 [Ogataea philodendri]|uniref:Uncharacterized protein n=1 Tax=Ogataea philodendri TaxID=1378263 RepID=A0A9P8T9D7_9ASCO|nr:uncharacterized protein OGAPHI_000989 [Ogataea philodendri]KAH3670474.1 hypothetical protein OGAPHI_000989 [Ogataea philodendri]